MEAKHCEMLHVPMSHECETQQVDRNPFVQCGKGEGGEDYEKVVDLCMKARTPRSRLIFLSCIPEARPYWTRKLIDFSVP